MNKLSLLLKSNLAYRINPSHAGIKFVPLEGIEPPSYP